MLDRGPQENLWLRTGSRIDRRLVLANVTGAALSAVSGALTAANVKGQPGFTLVDGIALAVYLPLSALSGHLVGKRLFRWATDWLLDGREPGAGEQQRTLALPRNLAAMVLCGWVGATVIWTVISAVHHPAAYTFRVAASIMLGGLTTTSLGYMLVESGMRPIVAIALANNVPARPTALGVRARLALAWAVGADVFFLMIGLTYVGRPVHDPPDSAAIWFIVGAGFLAGTAVVIAVARTLADPLRDLRAAVSRVESGDLETAVRVDDGGEVGLLQAGFNKMVQGLRERRILEDLFGRQVGEDVAREALARGVELGGERRETGVLFVDLIGSTALASRTPPDRVVELLNHFFSTVVRVVAAEGGWVNKFEGDGALCVFGAPAALEGAAGRALRAARTLRRELLALGALHPELDAAIGVSAGPVVAGNVGAEQRYEYTVIGPPVNEAARLTDTAKGRFGRVLASEDAVGRAEEEARSWMVVEEMVLRGHAEPVLVYEPVAGRRADLPSGSSRG